MIEVFACAVTRLGHGSLFAEVRLQLHEGCAMISQIEVIGASRAERRVLFAKARSPPESMTEGVLEKVSG